MPALRPWCCLLSVFSLASGAWAAPAVFWASDPVGPGETAVIIGEGLAGAQVQVVRAPDGPALTPAPPAPVGSGSPVAALQPSRGSLKFIVPASFRPGQFRFRLTTPEGATDGCLNTPVVWWLQGESGPQVAPGGTVRLFGKNLVGAPPQVATVLLTGPRELRLRATGDSYALRTTLPPDLPEGDFRVRVHSGYGGRGGWSEPVALTVRRATAWPTRRYDVIAYGAGGRGQTDDTEAIRSAIAAAAKAGGGVVFLPRGRYMVSATLQLPRLVTLKGAGRELVSVFWPDVDDPLPAQIKGTNSFGVEDLTFYCSNYARFLVGDDRQPHAGNVHLRRVTVRADRYRGHMAAEEVDRRLRKPGGNQVPLLTLGGEGVEVTDCDLYSSGMVFWLSRLRGATISRNVLSNGRWGWYCLSGSDGVIFEGNRIVGADLMATGGGLNCLDGSTYSQHVYYAHNTLSTMFGWDREAMTSDAGGGAYYGKVAAARECVVTVAEDLALQNRDWRGAGLYILDGTGAGQYRRVVSAAGRDITVDRPWQVAPDTSSIVTCCDYQGRCLFIGNDFADAGSALQFYGNAIEHIAAGNTSTRTAGFHNFGMQYSGGIQPNWYLQWLDNRIAEGNVYRGDHDNWRQSGEAHIGVYAFPPRADWDVPLTLATIVRRNRLDNNAHIMLGCEWTGGGFERRGRYVRDVLVEKNTVTNAQIGVFSYATAEGVLLRGNTFRAVATPLGGPGMAAAWVTSTEREAALRLRLSALVQGLGLALDPAALPPVATALAALRRQPDGAAPDEAPEGAALRAVLAHIAQVRPRGLPLSALAADLGLTVRMPWESSAHVLLQNRPEGGPAALELILTCTTPLGKPLLVTAEAAVAPGWESKPSAPAPLAAGTPARLSIPLVIPPREWASHDFPVTLSMPLEDRVLRLTTVVSAGSGYLRKWMLLGPFPNRSGTPLDITLLPPDDGIDLGAEYDGVSGKIRWQPWENGDWVNFKERYHPDKPQVAYAVACVNAPGELPAEVRVGCSGGLALTLNGEPVWQVDRSHRAGPAQERTRIVLRPGDNVLTFKLSSIIDEWTFVCELAPAPGGAPLTGVTVVSPTQFKGRECFAPPAPRSTPAAGEVRHPSGVDWQLVYADDFNRPTLGARWRVGSGTWRIVGEVLQASGVAFLSYAEKLPAPVRIEYDTRVPGQTGGDLSASWLGRPEDYTSGTLIGFGSNGNTLNKVLIDGTQVADASRPLVQPGKWHHVIAQVLADGRVQLIVDGQLAIDHRGPAPTGAAYPGLWSWGSDGVFARVRVFGAAGR